ncbi:SPOR domain-containing protein [Clostridium formicaceticum]|uniref:SPOR domain-containing protein n=1 Tax=Clostridium formicaceticum TaxID=1497 RepID=A0AAC9WFY6_9CLOT|nr:SPOR domain-containing protein [Clostridium formicaceticum]AOY76837.1 hypothetical protein BJL90_13840 [Clostridium formicaceticum]ARE87313.1 hypothetical protein CLFO_17120 [Clostridium formicaceticum]
MRKRRLKIRRNKRSFNYFWVITFLIIIPVTAVLIGSRITERIVVPVLYSDSPLEEGILSDIINNSDDNDETEVVDEVETNAETITPLEEVEDTELLPLSIYMIQIASVSDTSNIEELVEELNEKKLSHIVYKIDNAYKVYTLGLTDRGYVEEQLPSIRAFYPDAYISELHLPAKKITYSKDEEETGKNIVKDLNSLIVIIDKQAKEWYNFIKGEGELNQYSKLLTEHQVLMTQLSERLDTDVWPEGLPEKKAIEKMVLHQEGNIKKTTELLEDKENLYRVHSLFLDSLFRTLETIK